MKYSVSRSLKGRAEPSVDETALTGSQLEAARPIDTASLAKQWAQSIDVNKLLLAIENTRTPFVDRDREVIQLAIDNAKFVCYYLLEKNPRNPRGQHFVFAAQMFGAGKRAWAKSSLTSWVSN